MIRCDLMAGLGLRSIESKTYVGQWVIEPRYVMLDADEFTVGVAFEMVM